MRAMASDRRIIASSYLTVMGMPVLFLEIFWSFEFILSVTYIS
jgi:hypothetical protein